MEKKHHFNTKLYFNVRKHGNMKCDPTANETGKVSASPYLFSDFSWEAQQGSCGLACVSLWLHHFGILYAVSDLQTLE